MLKSTEQLMQFVSKHVVVCGTVVFVVFPPVEGTTHVDVTESRI